MWTPPDARLRREHRESGRRRVPFGDDPRQLHLHAIAMSIRLEAHLTEPQRTMQLSIVLTVGPRPSRSRRRRDRHLLLARTVELADTLLEIHEVRAHHERHRMSLRHAANPQPKLLHISQKHPIRRRHRDPFRAPREVRNQLSVDDRRSPEIARSQQTPILRGVEAIRRIRGGYRGIGRREQGG